MADVSAAPVRVITVNIHKGYTAFKRRYMLSELRNAVRAVDSDLVFLQEITGDAKQPHVTGRQCEYLADSIWRSHAYARNAVVDGQDHGNALLSRWPILGWNNHDVTQAGDEPRGLLHCVVQRPGDTRPLHAICVHLGLREWQRRRQLDGLVDLLSREVPAGDPVVVAGDFNDWRSRADHVLRDTGLVEVFRARSGRHARSFPASLPVLRLDRIYVRDVHDAQPLAMPRMPWAALSDHAPLAAAFALPRLAS